MPLKQGSIQKVPQTVNRHDSRCMELLWTKGYVGEQARRPTPQQLAWYVQLQPCTVHSAPVR